MLIAQALYACEHQTYQMFHMWQWQCSTNLYLELQMVMTVRFFIYSVYFDL